MDGQKLKDLLQCSYCNERLDEQSQVLPCQHTFCTKCLNIVVGEKGHLQCPECSTDYPELDIDNLPKNMLLLRILESLKNTKNAKKTVDSAEPLPENAVPKRDNIKPKDAVKRLSAKVNSELICYNIENKRQHGNVLVPKAEHFIIHILPYFCHLIP